MSKEAALDAVLEGLRDKLFKMSPEMGDILDQAKRGEITVEEAMERLTAHAMLNPDILEQLTVESQKAFVEGGVADPLDPEQQAAMTDLVQRSEAPPPEAEIFEDRSAEGKLARLNPLFEAALMERLQFDGDVPELRTGPLAPGVKPAVVVETDATNPIAIGRMLDTASSELREEQDALDRQYEALLEKESPTLEAGHNKSLALQRLNDPQGEPHILLPHWRKTHELEQKDGPPMIEYTRQDGVIVGGCYSPEEWTSMLVSHDATNTLEEAQVPMVYQELPLVPAPKGYEPGSVPAPRKVTTPTGGELLSLTLEEKQEAQWGFISTTQGRRTAAPVLWKKVRDRLIEAYGLVISSENDLRGNGDPEAHHAWTMAISGPRSSSTNFSAVDLAISSLVAGLKRELGDTLPSEELLLVIKPINTVHDRRVGWEGALFRA